MIVHNVYFALHDDSLAAQNELVAECQKYLTDNEGTVFFSAGCRQTEYQRDVNDLDFHVALNVVFADEAAHDRYQSATRHHEFIERNKANWKQVRVFDSQT